MLFILIISTESCPINVEQGTTPRRPIRRPTANAYNIGIKCLWSTIIWWHRKKDWKVLFLWYVQYWGDDELNLCRPTDELEMAQDWAETKLSTLPGRNHCWTFRMILWFSHFAYLTPIEWYPCAVTTHTRPIGVLGFSTTRQLKEASALQQTRSTDNRSLP